MAKAKTAPVVEDSHPVEVDVAPENPAIEPPSVPEAVKTPEYMVQTMRVEPALGLQFGTRVDIVQPVKGVGEIEIKIYREQGT